MSKDTIQYNIIIQTKLVTLTRREIIGFIAIFWVGRWYGTFCLFTPKLSLLFTEVSIGTLPSLYVRDVMVMYGELCLILFNSATRRSSGEQYVYVCC